jgi:hypothetical protein
LVSTPELFTYLLTYLLTELRELGFRVVGLDPDDFVASLLARSAADDIRPLVLGQRVRAQQVPY